MSPTTPLLTTHQRLGASLTEFGGWQMPLRYGSDIAEHRAVRTAAGLFDISHMGQISVVGPAAAAALDYALVGWLSKLVPGRARYTMVCAPDGGVIDDLVVYRLAADEFLVVANAGNATAVLAELVSRTDGFDATVRAVPGSALLALQGPVAESVLTSGPGLGATGSEAGSGADPSGSAPLTSQEDTDRIRALPYYAITDATVAGLPVKVARTGYTGEDGFELFVAADVAVALWDAVLAAGGPSGVVPAGLAARDSLRLEAGMPLYGHEIDLTTTPYEAGLGRVVRLDKTDVDGKPLDFVGRTPLTARRHSEPARVLVGLRGLGRRAVRAGDTIVLDDDSLDAVLGTVTSGVPSPTLGYPVAMAYVSPELSAVGSRLVAVVRGRPEPVEVVTLPFYRRQ